MSLPFPPSSSSSSSSSSSLPPAPSTSYTIVVASSDLPLHDFHLLAWTINMAARPGDAVLALHQRNRANYNAFEEGLTPCQGTDTQQSWFKTLQDLCDAKQVHLNLKVSHSSDADMFIIKNVSRMKANMLVVTIPAQRSRRYAQSRGNFLFSRVCERCSVVVVRDYKVLFHKENRLRARLLDEGEDKLLKPLANGEKALTRGVDSYAIGSCYKAPLLDADKPLSPRRVLDGSQAFDDLDENLAANDRTRLLTSLSKEALSSSEFQDDEDPSSLKRSQSCLSIWTKGRKVSRSYTFPPIKQRRKTTTYHNIFTSPLKYFMHTLLNISLPKRLDFKMTQSMVATHKWKNFTYEEVLKATNFFSPDNLVGKGGHSEVYKGLLGQGQLVAVKRLKQSNSQDQLMNEFLMELGMLCQLSHPNITRFVGYCSDNGLYLVFQYLERGSLDSWLHDRKFPALKWAIRYRIALGTARGLNYLHSDCRHRIIHRDIKAANILLGPNFEAQISDFGLARWLPYQCSQIMTEVEGTFGYLAPEYFMHGLVDEKTDIFAFGVLLLELITGYKPIESLQPSLLVWVKPLLEAMDVEKLVDRRLRGIFNHQEVKSMLMAAALCVQQSPKCRPSMLQVLQLLNHGLPQPHAVESLAVHSARSICFEDPGFDSDYSSSDYRDDLRRHKEIAMQF